MPRLFSFVIMLFLSFVILLSLSPGKLYAGEEKAGEPTVDPEGEKEKPEKPKTLEERMADIENQMKEEGTQTPDSQKMTLTGSVRTRHERVENYDFTYWLDDRADASLLRSRLGIDAMVNDIVGCFVEIEDSRYFGQAVNPVFTASHEADTLDLWQGYVRLNFWETEDSGIQIGRQEIVQGDERMVGNFEWGNYGRAFDAARCRWNDERHFIDTWYATMDETFDRRSQDIEFAGVYYSNRSVENQEFDFYFLHYRDGARTTESELTETINAMFGPVVAPDISNLIVETFGARADGALPAGDVSMPYNAELIYQWGHWGPDRVQSWAIATRIGLRLDAMPWVPMFQFVYNRAKGDSDPFDQIHETPHTPYPTNHQHYGLMDFFSWRNMRQIGIRGRVTPFSNKETDEEMFFEAAYYTFHLDESLDAWYAASGLPISLVFPDVPHVNTHVGEELDVRYVWKIAKWSSISAGFGVFLPRDYVRHAIIGHPDNAVWFFVQFLVKF
ncbi:MAG: alginate export family protein [Planctomycetota bacterium]|jgi:hypothetical protein